MPKSITLTFTAEQFQSLAKLVFLGDWMANNSDDLDEPKFFDAKQLVYAKAKEAGMQEQIEFDESLKEYSSTLPFDLGMYPVIEQYNDDIFWEEFINRLVLRDLLKKYSMDQLAEMTIEERMLIREPFLATYEDIFDRIGMESVRIIDNPPNLIQIN